MRPSNNAVLIGPGMVADMHARAIAASGTGVRLHGVLARTADKGRAFGDRHGAGRVYDTLADLIADPDAGFVILTTPPDARGDIIAQLAAARIPILCEKPLERDHAGAARLVDLCAATGTPFGAVLQHRMRPAAQTLMTRLHAGDLGRIGSVEVRIPWWRDQSYYDAPGRGTYDRDGGGVLITQAIHTIDLMLHLCGPVTGVQGLVATTPLHDLEAEDFAASTLRFRSGAVGSLCASTTHYPGGPEGITLNGTRGSATLSAASLVLSFQDGRTETIGASQGSGGGADPMAFTHDWHQRVIEDFAAALAANRPPAIPARAALAAHRLIDAITQSSRTGTRLTLPEETDG